MVVAMSVQTQSSDTAFVKISRTSFAQGTVQQGSVCMLLMLWLSQDNTDNFQYWTKSTHVGDLPLVKPF